MSAELGFWSSANLLLLLVVITIILRSNHASAASYLGNDTDRLALFQLKYQISDDPQTVLSTWNDSVHHCKWAGVTCDARHQRVTALALQGKSLFGSISPHIGNLSFLKSVKLQNNSFNGEIPLEIGRLFRLRELNLSFNKLSGEIPVNLSRCIKLRSLSLGHNKLRGKIPVELASLPKLVFLRLSANNLTGGIPPSFVNISSLYFLSLTRNNLDGTLPNEIGSLASLSHFLAAENKLTGTIPSSFYNISTIVRVALTMNFLHGNLPEDIGLKFPNLQLLFLGENSFHGNIPMSIANASNLEYLCIPYNYFEGKVPTTIGSLHNLKDLNLECNFLGLNSTEDFDFISSLTNYSSLAKLSIVSNNLGGKLPSTIGNLTSLRRLLMGDNKISGTIPVGLGNLIDLYVIGLEMNYLEGPISSEFGNLKKLQVLHLGENMLSRQVPSDLYNITSLYHLVLEKNNFDGTLPPSLGNCQQLKILEISWNKFTGNLSPLIFGRYFSPVHMDFSCNSFTGSLPLEVGKLLNIQLFNASNNRFTGEIPGTLGGCSSLEYLDIQSNLFTGTIPGQLALLKGIQHLDLSRNNLSGEIPKDLEKLTSLKYLNLSFNNLQGEIPTNGVFENASQTFVDGNVELCGGIAELKLPPCLIQRKKNQKFLVILITGILSGVLILIFVVTLFCYRNKESKNLSSTPTLGVNKIIRVSYHELQRATAGFSPENLIGSGNFGFVYKGRLDQCGEKLVAIKVLDLQKNGASKSFKAECRALRNVRHRNLLSMLTYCSSTDFKGHEFKALVYEYMENGSLDMWLHPENGEGTRSRNLNLLQRLNVAIDVASALHYLHNHCDVAIVHCDLKPSNILLGGDLTAHVGDFGLASLLHRTKEISFSQGSSSAVVARGSIGYAAPEYGLGHEPSTQGDVYSYGILLLEMLTGKRPTYGIFADGLDLHNYVKTNLPEQVMKIVDISLVSREVEGSRQVEEQNDVEMQIELSDGKIGKFSVDKESLLCLLLIFDIGLKCSALSPKDRMDMNEIVRELHHIKESFF